MVMAIWFGVYPTAVLRYMTPSVNKTVDDLAQWTVKNEHFKLPDEAQAGVPVVLPGESGPTVAQSTD